MHKKTMIFLCLVTGLYGCTNHNAKDYKASKLSTISNDIQVSKDSRLRAEIKERTDFDAPRSASTEKLENILSNIVDKGYQRYSSHKLGDVLNIKISDAKITKNNYTYVMRPVNFTISRSDSRMIPFKDLDFLESGIETNVRFTYSENGILYINGVKKLRVSLNAKPTTDYQRVTLKDDETLLFEYKYSLPQ